MIYGIERCDCALAFVLLSAISLGERRAFGSGGCVGELQAKEMLLRTVAESTLIAPNALK